MSASTEPASAVRFLEPRVGPIEKATDLGSVQVLKHGNMFLLTDQFGDIHSDSRGLGLYRNDTRLLSCSVLRVGGARPVLLQGSIGANYRGVIQLTNPTLDRNPDDKIRPGEGLVGRTLGITRERLVSGDVLRGADHDRQLRRGRRDGRGRRSSWPTTRPTSSRSAAIPATAARCCRSPPTTSG